MILLWGASKAGKTSLLAGLSLEATKSDGVYTIRGQSDEARRFLRTKMQDLQAGRFPPKTAFAREQENFSECYEFEVTKNGKLLARLNFLDPPGDPIGTGSFLRPNEAGNFGIWVQRNIELVRGVLFAVDFNDMEESSASHLDMMLESLQFFLMHHNQENRLTLPIVFCLTKADVRPELFTSVPTGETKFLHRVKQSVKQFISGMDEKEKTAKRLVEEALGKLAAGVARPYLENAPVGYVATSCVGFRRHKGRTVPLLRPDEYGVPQPVCAGHGNGEPQPKDILRAVERLAELIQQVGK